MTEQNQQLMTASQVQIAMLAAAHHQASTENEFGAQQSQLAAAQAAADGPRNGLEANPGSAAASAAEAAAADHLAALFNAANHAANNAMMSAAGGVPLPPLATDEFGREMTSK